MSRVPGWLGRLGDELSRMGERLDERRAEAERDDGGDDTAPDTAPHAHDAARRPRT